MHPIIYSIGSWKFWFFFIKKHIFRKKDVSAGKNAHIKFIEELTQEEQKEFAKLVDKNEDLFKENNKLKTENNNLKNDLAEIKSKIQENDKKIAEMQVLSIFNWNKIVKSLKQEKEVLLEKKENYKNQYKGLKLSYDNMEYF